MVITGAAAEVGPALFFSLVIITLSFVPVFTLQAQEGRLFAPLAFTKTYAMAGAAILSVTLVPVLMGLLIRGRIPREDANPLNRWLAAAYRPAALAALTAALERGERALTPAVLALRPRLLTDPELERLEGGLENFFNLNTPEDLAAAERRLGVISAASPAARAGLGKRVTT